MDAPAIWSVNEDIVSETVHQALFKISIIKSYPIISAAFINIRRAQEEEHQQQQQQRCIIL